MDMSGAAGQGEAVVDGVEGSGRVGLGKAVKAVWVWKGRDGRGGRGEVRSGRAWRNLVWRSWFRRSTHGGARSGELWSGGLRIGGLGVAGRGRAVLAGRGRVWIGSTVEE